MVQRVSFCRLLAAVMLYLAAAMNLSAQGTAISYQGRLYVSGSPANTNVDFRFSVWDAITNGIKISPYVTNLNVPVSNGLFSVVLDFGAGVFNGTDNGSNDWMDIGVRAIGGPAFTNLYPRQAILPVPYALFATSASNLLGSLQATQLVGTAQSSLVTGTFTNAVNFSNGSNTFAGSFSGNGAGLTNLNASQLTTGAVSDARLQSDVDLLDQSQTFTASKTFSAGNNFNGANVFTASNSFTSLGQYTGINNFVNTGNSFFGSFFGNGLVGWFPLVATATNAMRDAGYLTLNAGLSTVTLPTTASLSVDDIVRVAGGGTGGWLVKENTGQSVVGNFLAYRNGYLEPAPGATINGYSVAASADGVRMYVVGGDITGLLASYDSGEHWTHPNTSILSGDYNSVACSANGKIVYIQQAGGGGNINESTDAGVTWAIVQSATTSPIACSADGSKLITGGAACSGNGVYQAIISAGKVEYSVNSGVGFNQTTTQPGSGSVTWVAASSDCTKLVAAISNGLLYASSNLGASWTTLTVTNQNWSGVWMSPDGSKIAATASLVGTADGGLYRMVVEPTPYTSNTNSTIGGSQGSAVELQYLGGGAFMPVGSVGMLWSN